MISQFGVEMKVVGRQLRHKDLESGGLVSTEAYFLDLFSLHPTFFNYLSYSPICF